MAIILLLLRKVILWAAHLVNLHAKLVLKTDALYASKTQYLTQLLHPVNSQIHS